MSKREICYLCHKPILYGDEIATIGLLRKRTAHTSCKKIKDDAFNQGYIIGHASCR